jgi:hypothetical protein
MIDIEDMMGLVESRFDTWFYEHVSGFEIKHEKETGWNLRKIPESGKYGGVWVQFNTKSYDMWFNKFSISLHDFQMQLYESCLTEAIYHKSMYDNLKELLGSDEVDSAEMDFIAFGEAIAGEIGKIDRKRNIKLL